MNIGIYGDSYAACHKLGNGVPWFTMLTKNFNIEATSYGVAGSSLYYSYKKFIETHHKYKKIVFLTTGPYRVNLPIPQEYIQRDARLEHVNQFENFESIVKSNHNSIPYLRNLVTAVKNYFTYIIDYKKEELFHRMLIKEIKEIRPDALIIPCFYISGAEKWPWKETLGDVTKIDFNFYNLTTEYGENKDKRHCHLNQENNFIFSQMIAEWANNGLFNFDFKKFTLPTKPVDYYFRV